MVITNIILIGLLSGLLSVATRTMINSFKKINRRVGGNEFALSAVLIGIGTSIPELVIGIDSALKGNPDLSLGNVLGSNIANLSLVVGGATLLAGKLKIMDSVLKSDIFYAFMVAAAPLLLISDGRLTRLDGLVLLLLYTVWQGLIATKKKRRQKYSLKSFKSKLRLIASLPHSLITLALSLATLLLTAELLVKTAVSLAGQLEIPNFILGVFVLGVGSSLPELALETRAIKGKEGAIALGDLLGSIVANSSLVLGLTVIISPLSLSRPQQYFSTTLYFLLIFLLFYLFIKSKKTLEKWEAAFLVASYFILLAFEFG